MNAQALFRGAAPVGYVSHLDAVEQVSVRLLRAWSDGPNGWEDFESRFRPVLGEVQTRLTHDALTQICQICAEYGRRPLMCHSANCLCLGADESCFASFVANAADGRREEALLVATLIVRPDVAFHLLAHAETLGRNLAQYALRSPGDAAFAVETKNMTLH